MDSHVNVKKHGPKKSHSNTPSRLHSVSQSRAEAMFWTPFAPHDWLPAIRPFPVRWVSIFMTAVPVGGMTLWVMFG